MMRIHKMALVAALCSVVSNAWAQKTAEEKFRQLYSELPTPNTYRTASGAPGHEYWQQRADYNIRVTLDEAKQTVTGAENITYYNNSPDPLPYLWVQLDQNIFKKDNETYNTETITSGEGWDFDPISFTYRREFDGGYRILSVKGAEGKPLPYVINKTMMRIDLPKPLAPKSQVSFSIEWFNNINECSRNGGRGGFEYFPKDNNHLFEMAQWFPRMAVYDDVTGWQHKQYMGRGEFALPFGNYKVAITVPSDHIVASTGSLQNADQVLNGTQRKRLEEARNATRPVVIVTQAEAEEAEKSRSTKTKTWVYHADNVRDFAWASSRKFIWDAMGVMVGNRNVLAMSYYPKEGNPLWGQYSTEVVAHTIKTYSKFTIDYPYPVAISVHGPVGGMEYPMISFNGGRPEADGTYPEGTKRFLVGVVIHEVGHNFFPMIVNSDERQWTWMDEGLNSFVQYLTEQEFERNWPSRSGEPWRIVPYMKSDKAAQTPIMTNSESILQFGPNAYSKPATALNILRETVLGRKLFDHAFKTYCQRWAFRHPQPADFFRTMEDASGTDLDWFWRGWFYGVDHCDIAIKNFAEYQINQGDPRQTAKALEDERTRQLNTLSAQRNKEDLPTTVTETKPYLQDFYNSYDPAAPTEGAIEQFQKSQARLNANDARILAQGLKYYRIDLQNVGGLVMPVILKLKFEDKTDSIVRIPAEIWRYNSQEVSRVILSKKAIAEVELDPYMETADVEYNNNFWPTRTAPTRFQLYRESRRGAAQPNPMQQKKKATGTNP